MPRIKYLDYAKGLAIIMIVLYHSFSLEGDSLIRDSISLYILPLFFFISGCFYKDKYTSNLFLLFRKRIKTLYWPFIKYGAIFLVLHNLFFKLGIYTDKYLLLDFFKNFFEIITLRMTEAMLGGFWFIGTLFPIVILFGLLSFFVNKIFKKNSEVVRFILILLCFFSGHIIRNYPLLVVRGSDRILIFLLFYYLGYLYRKHEKKVKLSLNLILGLLFSLLVFIIYDAQIRSVAYWPIIFPVVAAIPGISLVLFVSKKIQKFNLPLLDYIGKNTLFILAFHFLAFKLVSLLIIHIYDKPAHLFSNLLIEDMGLWQILYFLTGVFVPIAFKYLIDTFLPRK